MSPHRGNGHQGVNGSAARPREDVALDFAARLEAAFRPLWLTAVAIVGDATAAEDVVQEAALIALGKLDQFQPDAPGSSFHAWMGQIVRFVALNYRRKDRRQGRRSEPEELDRFASRRIDEPEHAAPGGQLAPDQGLFDDDVTAALQDLSETARACLLLRTLESMEYKEIAALLGIPEGTAMSHVHRSRTALRDRLADHRPGPGPPPSDPQPGRRVGPGAGLPPDSPQSPDHPARGQSS